MSFRDRHMKYVVDNPITYRKSLASLPPSCIWLLRCFNLGAKRNFKKGKRILPSLAAPHGRDDGPRVTRVKWPRMPPLSSPRPLAGTLVCSCQAEPLLLPVSLTEKELASSCESWWCFSHGDMNQLSSRSAGFLSKGIFLVPAPCLATYWHVI